MSSSIIEQRFRRFLLVVPAFIFMGTIVELWLAGHTQEAPQFIPFILSFAGLAALGAVWFRPQRNTLLILRVVMVVVIAGSLLGITLHLVNNFQFELEIRPNATVGDVWMDALTGANPLLAPGILALSAILAIASTYYHPLLSDRGSHDDSP